MKILLAGSSGQLGQELLPGLRRLGRVVSVDRSVGEGSPDTVRQDLSDLNRCEILLNRTLPDLIVNAAAYTAVDRAEDETEAAFRLNAELPGCLARWSARNDRMLVHYSTDYVFSGSGSRPYRENDPTGPRNAYGESKLAGEWAVQNAGCRQLTLRTSWVYSSHGNNFVLTMLRLARERPALSVVSDQTGCPTWARNLAQVTLTALDRLAAEGGSSAGLYHYCDEGVVSWYDFAHAIFSIAQQLGILERVPEMTAVPSSEFPQKAERPLYSVLDATAIRRDLGIMQAGLRESLKSCLEEVDTDE
jgi:dTDP-4-dehydrorhamnose reductase